MMRSKKSSLTKSVFVIAIILILITSCFSVSFGASDVKLPTSSSNEYVQVEKGQQFTEKKTTKEIKLDKKATKTYSEKVSTKTLKSEYTVITGPGNHPYSITEDGYLQQSLNKRKKVITDYYTKGSKIKKRVTKILATPVTYTWKGYKKEIDLDELAPKANAAVKRSYEASGWRVYMDTDLNMNGTGPETQNVFGYTTTDKQNIRLRDPQTIYHELGHFVDYKYSLTHGGTWANAESSFKSSYKQEYLKIPSDYRVAGSVTSVESFACFYDFYCRDQELMKEKCPNAYAYIVNLLNEL